MMVLLISRSTGKSQKTVRTILDSFAERIGDDAWRTVITSDGLEAVRTALRRNATKNTAVSCHWIRSRARSDLLWIVGDRSQFNDAGAVPVNTTKKKIIHSEWENDWQYLPIIKELAGLAGLFHDWGKASDFFQKKLRSGTKERDPFRHEWMSCKMIEACVEASGDFEDDTPWLKKFADGTFEEEIVLNILKNEAKAGKSDVTKLKKLPPAAECLTWLILSHHKLPDLNKDDRRAYEDEKRETFYEMMKSLKSSWGYENDDPDFVEKRQECFRFSHGILWNEGNIWKKHLKKWTGRLLQDYDTLKQIMKDPDYDPAFREILLNARLALVLGDHYFSSLDGDAKQDDGKWSARDLWANTFSFRNKKRKSEKNQFLEEHMTGVSDQALRVAHQLPRFAEEMEKTYDVKALKKRSPGKFSWQDKAAETIRNFRKDRGEDQVSFVVNIASTGCGKTFANAKIMRALSPGGDSLRYILALGLRTLTLQTGDEYRERIKLSKDDLAVLIGSKAVLELHEGDKELEEKRSAMEDEDGEDISLAEGLAYEDSLNDEQRAFMNIFFKPARGIDADKNSAFLYKPVLVATIDHMMGATETIRGGRFILPMLRLMSSDLVIDEIDDFTQKDLTAISRLVHLAGMYGRNVVLSSATIPPDLAEGMYRAYIAGVKCRNSFFISKKRVSVVLCDEFRTEMKFMNTDDDSDYSAFHQSFIEKRVAKLTRQITKRSGYIADCEDEDTDDAKSDKMQSYFESIRKQVVRLSKENFVVDEKTGKKVSIGVVRMANIDPCVKVSLYLLQNTDWDKDDITPHIMTYHSRQILLLRHEQEKYLDSVLKRKTLYGEPVDIKDPVLRKHIDQATTDYVVFIIVATPVEEVGRDHDLDWSVIEPSSYRSIIQLAGRVLRHRIMSENIEKKNIAVMRWNLRGLNGKAPAFIYPGYESGKNKLESHDLKGILKEDVLKRIDSIPRIRKEDPLTWRTNLIDFEQKAMEDFNDKESSGAKAVNGWIREYWWMTALPQRLNRFREKTYPDVRLTALFEDNKIKFSEYIDREFVSVGRKRSIEAFPKFKEGIEKNLWLKRDYKEALKRYVNDSDFRQEEEILFEKSEKYGEIIIPDNLEKEWFYSDQFGLFSKTSV